MSLKTAWKSRILKLKFELAKNFRPEVQFKKALLVNSRRAFLFYILND